MMRIQHVMDILVPFKIVSLLLSLGVIIYSIKALPNGTPKTYFIMMIACFFSSTILFFPEGRISDWIKHIPFYIGQIFFYLFLNGLIVGQTKQTSSHSEHPVDPMPPATTAIIGGVGEWFNFITDQGIQHFLTVPLFFLIMAIIQVHYIELKDAVFKRILTFCLIAGACLTMIHLGEFFIESQGFFPFLNGDPIEIVEFIWYYSAIILFFITLHKFAGLHTIKLAHV